MGVGHPPPTPSDDGSGQPVTVDALVHDLRPVVRAGLERASAPTTGHLADIVDRHAEHAGYEPTDDGRAAALRDLIRDAINSLGDGAPADAARALFGDSAGTRYRSLVERRGIAAETLDVADSTFRRRYQRRILRDLAQHLYATQHRAPPDPTTTEPDTPAVRPGGIDPDDTTATVIALFDDEETGDRENLRVIAVPAPTRREQLGQLVGGLRSRYRYDRYLLVAVAAGFISYRYGGTALLQFAAVLIIIGLLVVAAGIVRNRSLRTTSTAQVLYQRAPRLLLLAFAGFLILNQIDPGSDPEPRRAANDHGLCLTPGDTDCPSTTTTTIPDVTLPYAAAHEPVTPTCPPADNAQRLLSFNDPPPVCINPARDYVAHLDTSYGRFNMLLNTEAATYTVNNFVFLARWNFYDGVHLVHWPPRTADLPPFEPELPGDYLVLNGPVAPEHTDNAPGYYMTFDYGPHTYPDDNNTVYAIATFADHPDRFSLVISPTAHRTIENSGGAYPMLGQVIACPDIITDDAREGLQPRFQLSAPLVIRDVTITEHDRGSITVPRSDRDPHCREDQASGSAAPASD